MHVAIADSISNSRGREKPKRNGSNDQRNDSRFVHLLVSLNIPHHKNSEEYFAIFFNSLISIRKLAHFVNSSWSTEEREKPELLAESPARRKRVATESGRTEKQVNMERILSC